MSELYNQRALELKALSDPNRLVILDQLKDGERCACKILELLKISQPTLSHHMRILCQAGLVNCRREGKWMHYRLNGDKFVELSKLMESFCVQSAKLDIFLTKC
ncbi:MAG: putative transcriptional regulator [Herbinix sp.]|jgi:ArsR family transcriptional regulator|nr:putative transcriptional regulator [Herbinix sp.]